MSSTPFTGTGAGWSGAGPGAGVGGWAPGQGGMPYNFNAMGFNPTAQGGTPNTSGGSSFDPSSIFGDLSGATNLAGGIMSLIQGSQLTGDASTILNQSNPFGGYRPIYGAQLLNLIQNPSSVTQLPGYQFQLDQGLGAINRQAAVPGSGGGIGAGNTEAALEKYGQGLASSFYNQQVQTLSQLAGAGISPANPADALNALSGAQGSTGAGLALLGKGIQGLSPLVNNLLSGSGGGMPTGTGFNMNDPFSSGGGAPPNFNLGGTDPNLGGGGFNISDPSLGGGDMSGVLPVGGDSGLPDLSGLFSTFNSAGGEAATTAGQVAGASAGQSAGQSLGSELGAGLGGIGGLAGLIGGIQSGGVAGYGRAVGGAAQAGAVGANFAGNQALSQGLGEVAGAVAIPLSVYNFAKNWQSGATAPDALSGMGVGASIGTAIEPGIGTVVGAVLGLAGGALSSAFGPGKTDPEQYTFQGYLNAYEGAGKQTEQALPGYAETQLHPNFKGGDIASVNPAMASLYSRIGAAAPSQAEMQAAYKAGGAAAVQGASGAEDFQALAGLFDARSSTLPFYNKFGRGGEGAFTEAMMGQVNSAIKSGRISAASTPTQIFDSVVNPWIMGMGGWGTTGPGSVSGGQDDVDAVQQLLINMIGNYQQGSPFVSVGGQNTVPLPAYG